MPTIRKKYEALKAIIEYLDQRKEELELEISQLGEKCPHAHVVPHTTNLFQKKYVRIVV